MILEFIKKRWFDLLWGTINVVLIVCVVLSVVYAFNSAKNISFKQNVENVQTLTDSAASRVSLEIDNHVKEIKWVSQYINSYSENGMDIEQLKVFFNSSFSNEVESSLYSWQIINNTVNDKNSTNEAFKGILPVYLTTKTVSYNTTNYDELAKYFSTSNEYNLGTVRFSKEFTDPISQNKVFAFVTPIKEKIYDEESNSYDFEYRTLMCLIRSKDIIKIIESISQDDLLSYNDYSSVIIDKSGNYVVSTNYFQGKNFINFIKTYNDDFDDEEDIENTLNDGTIKTLFYSNNKEEDCLYSFSRISGGEWSEWYILSVVPTNSFHNSYNFNYQFSRFAFFFAILFLADLFWFIKMINQLKIHMSNEKKANLAKSSFMSRMSHEIRTPLNAIIGYNIIAMNEIGDAKTTEQRKNTEMKILDYLTKSDLASKHLLSIINDVLDMSSIESGKIKVANELFDFKGLIMSLTTIFYSQAKNKGIDFEVLFESLTEERFIGDQMRVNQILTNLLSNAVKFTPEGGSVKLIITQPEGEKNSTHIHFRVTDTGIGMSKEYIDRIWAPFEQADSSISRRFGGSGLGLSITKSLVDLMNGKIEVISQLSVGTTFDVDLVFGKHEGIPENENVYNFSKINALVVDDDQSTCDYIRLIFNRCGAKCTTATSGADAIQAVSKSIEKGDKFSIFLIDLRMPKMDGIETTKEIRKIVGDELPIIVLSAYDYSEIAEYAIDAGITSFISKPFFQSTIFDLLASISSKEIPKKISMNKKYNFKNKRVLLAEDNLMNMEIAKKIMEFAGIVVDSAWNGKEALEKFTSSSEGTYNAILMDVHMPEMDGYQATKLIRASTHPQATSIPIIALTADAFAENIIEIIQVGMNGHISKPIDLKALFTTLEQYLH